MDFLYYNIQILDSVDRLLAKISSLNLDNIESLSALASSNNTCSVLTNACLLVAILD
jgi:hypothetical protein